MVGIVQKRNNIDFGTMSGERGDVNDTVVDDWKQKLPTLCAGYDAKDIWNGLILSICQ